MAKEALPMPTPFAPVRELCRKRETRRQKQGAGIEKLRDCEGPEGPSGREAARGAHEAARAVVGRDRPRTSPRRAETLDGARKQPVAHDGERVGETRRRAAGEQLRRRDEAASALEEAESTCASCHHAGVFECGTCHS